MSSQNEIALGNVWEWVADWYDSGYYVVSPAQNPVGPVTGDTRVVRGGSWAYDVRLVRAAARLGHGFYPQARYDYVGIRVVVSPGW